MIESIVKKDSELKYEIEHKCKKKNKNNTNKNCTPINFACYRTMLYQVEMPEAVKNDKVTELHIKVTNKNQ